MRDGLRVADGFSEGSPLEILFPASLALLFGIRPTALAALAFEHANRPAGIWVHHLADNTWQSAASATTLLLSRLNVLQFFAE